LFWFIHYFTSCSRIFQLYGDVTITGEGLHNLGLCSALRAFEHGGIFIMSPAVTRVLGFPVSSEGPSHVITSCDSQGVAEDQSYRILTGPHLLASYDTQWGL
jgi:hypothetical protein